MEVGGRVLKTFSRSVDVQSPRAPQSTADLSKPVIEHASPDVTHLNCNTESTGREGVRSDRAFRSKHTPTFQVGTLMEVESVLFGMAFHDRAKVFLISYS